MRVKQRQNNKAVIAGGLVLAAVVLATVTIVWKNSIGTDSAGVVFAQLIGTDKPGKDGLLPINDPLFQMYQKWLATADELNRVNQQIARIKKEIDLERWEKLLERKTALERGLLKIDIEAAEYELKKETNPARKELLEGFLEQKQEMLKYLNEHGELPPLLPAVPAPPESPLPSPQKIIEKEKREFDEEIEKQRRLLEEIKKPRRSKEAIPSASEKPDQTSNICDELKKNLGYQPVQNWKRNADSRKATVEFYKHSQWQIDMMKRLGAPGESVAESEAGQVVKNQLIWLWKEIDKLVANAGSMDELSPTDQMKFALLMELNNVTGRRLGIMQDLYILRGGGRGPLKIAGPDPRMLKAYNDMMKEIRVETDKRLSGSDLSEQLKQIDKRIRETEKIIRDPGQKQQALEWGRLWGELQLLKQMLEEAMAYLAATPEPQ